MRKKPTKKEQRIEQEIADIELVLRDLALGANGGYPIDDECGIVGGMGIKEFGAFLKAAEIRFEIGRTLDQDEDADWELKMALDFSRFEHLESFDSMARHLHKCGVRW